MILESVAVYLSLLLPSVVAALWAATAETDDWLRFIYLLVTDSVVESRTSNLSLSLPLCLSAACQVDLAMSSRHTNQSNARRLAVARPKLRGRRSSSTVLSQDCLDLPVLRRQSLGGRRMHDWRAREWSWLASARDAVPTSNRIAKINESNRIPIFSCRIALRGVATGVYRIWVFIPPKSAQVNFLWGKMTSERLFNSFIPQKLLYPQKQISGYAPDRSKKTVKSLLQNDAEIAI